MDEPNPYAPPLVESLAKPDPTSLLPADIRMLHRTHEAALRQVGLYYILTSSLGLLFSAPLMIFMVGSAFGSNYGNDAALFAAFLLSVLTAFLVLGIIVGVGLRKLNRQTVGAATFSAVIWMLHFPVGTIVNIYLLYLLYSKKGRRILQDDYQNIIAATPEMNFNRDWEVWCVFGLWLFLLIGFAAVVALVTAS